MTKTAGLQAEKDAEDSPWSDEDDDAPEAVSFIQGRQEALQSKSDAQRDQQRAKLQVKEKRRQRDKLLKEQKQRKKVSLSHARLPPGLLTKLTEQEDKTPGSREPKASERVEDEDREEDGDEDEDDDFSGSEEEEEEPTIQVIQRSKMLVQPPHEAALQFLQNQMYGSRVPRESTAQHVSRKLKRLGKPAMIFSRNRSQGGKKEKKSKRSVASGDVS